MENDRKQDAERIVANMEKENLLSKLEEVIKDNKITFEHDGVQYRARMLTLKEKDELDSFRRKKFGQLIQDKDILLEKDLIEIYKERGLNIDEIDEDIKKLNAEDTDQQLKLGEAISKNEPESILIPYKDKIEELRIKKQILNAQKTLLLEYSLENQLLNYVAQIITYLSLETFKNNQWERMFENLEDFMSYKDESFITKAGQYSMVLQYF